jgi:hypothetical protein
MGQSMIKEVAGKYFPATSLMAINATPNICLPLYRPQLSLNKKLKKFILSAEMHPI